MSTGFSQPIGDQPATIGQTSNVGNTLVANLANVATNTSYFVANHCESFQSIVIAVQYFGENPFVIANGDFLQLEFLWFDSTNTLIIGEPVTVEVISDRAADFTGKPSFITIPVHGSTLVVSANNGSGGGGAHTMTLRAYGTNRTIAKAELGSDAASFQGTDNLILQKSGGAIASGGNTGRLYGCLASGSYTISATLTFTTGGAFQGGVQITFGFGSSAANIPPILVTQPSTGFALPIGTAVTGYFLPRRPIYCVITDTAIGVGHDTVATWSLSIFRDER